MKSLPKLSPTSYALLGLLARGPASAYELNTIMQTSMLRVFWPRAESHVYSEPKKLLAHGLVTEAKEKTGRRSRTVFTVTEQGREKLAEWLATPDKGEHRSQAEFMLKVILAEGGTPGNVRNTVAGSLETTREEIAMAIAGIEEVLATVDSGPALGMPWNGFAANLMADILIARLRWGQYASKAIAAVPTDADREEKQVLGQEAYRRALDKLREVRDE